MPIIQRNLFPSRPPSKVGDGPSILRAATGNNNGHIIHNPNLTLYNSSTLNHNNNTGNGNGINGKFNKNTTNNESASNAKGTNALSNNNSKYKPKNEMGKLKKIHSASMISLSAINGLNGYNASRKTNGKINYDSQDSFHSSDAR